MAHTKRGMKRLVRRIASAIDAAKKGRAPSPSCILDAEMGVVRALIELCAYEYATENPCGCNDHESGFEAPRPPDDDGTLLLVPEDEPTLLLDPDEPPILLDDPPRVERAPRPLLDPGPREPTPPPRKFDPGVRRKRKFDPGIIPKRKPKIPPIY